MPSESWSEQSKGVFGDYCDGVSFGWNRDCQINSRCEEENWYENPVLHYGHRDIKKAIGVIKGLLSGISIEIRS